MREQHLPSRHRFYLAAAHRVPRVTTATTRGTFSSCSCPLGRCQGYAGEGGGTFRLGEFQRPPRAGMARRIAQNGAPTHEIERQGRGKQVGGRVRPLHPGRIGRVGTALSVADRFA